MRNTINNFPDNPYTILGVAKEASLEDIKAAYKQQAKQFHPDLYSGSSANSRMQKLNWAYALLTDPLRRKDVDHKFYGPAEPKANQSPNRAGYSTNPTPESRGSYQAYKGQYSQQTPKPSKSGHKWSWSDLGGFLFLLILGACVVDGVFPGTIVKDPYQQEMLRKSATNQNQSVIASPTVLPTATLPSGGIRGIGKVVYFIPEGWCFSSSYMDSGLEGHGLVSNCTSVNNPNAVLWITQQGKSPQSSFDGLMQEVFAARANGYLVLNMDFLDEDSVPSNLGEDAAILLLTVTNPDINMPRNITYIASFGYKGEYYIVETHLTDDQVTDSNKIFLEKNFFEFLNNLDYLD